MSTPNPPGASPGPQDEGPRPQGYGYPQYGPYPSGYPLQPTQPYSYPGYAIDPQAPYGRDAATGHPLSDKSAVAAGCLQLFFGCFGVGRFYIGSTNIAVIQLCLGLFGFLMFIFCLIGLPFFIGACIWGIVDGIMMLTGSVSDPQGRKLRS